MKHFCPLDEFLGDYFLLHSAIIWSEFSSIHTFRSCASEFHSNLCLLRDLLCRVMHIMINMHHIVVTCIQNFKKWSLKNCKRYWFLHIFMRLLYQHLHISVLPVSVVYVCFVCENINNIVSCLNRSEPYFLREMNLVS